MSTKHFFTDAGSMVIESLRTLAACNPHIGLDEPNRVIYSKTHPPSRVAIVSGGGSGHEPAWSGYVGDGMLASVANGDIFASPSAKQVSAAIDIVASDTGVILAITNYTGDNLHFGLAREKALAKGLKKVAILRATDDAVLPRKTIERTGRRGLAGNILTLKIIGAAAQADWNFEQVLELGEQLNLNLVTIGSSLDHCDIPGRVSPEKVPEDVCVLGMGIHNEPGLQKIKPIPSIEELMKEMLGFLLALNDGERSYVEFKPDDVVVLFVNNFGGLSNVELNAIAQVAIRQLKQSWKIVPVRVFSGTFETSLNGPGFSVSLCNVSGVSRSISNPTDTILSFIDAPTDAPAWPRTTSYRKGLSDPTKANGAVNGANKRWETKRMEVQVNPESLEQSIRKGCNRAIDAEPILTKWDMQMGDGDCGEAVKAVLAKLDKGITKSGSLFATLEQVLDCMEDIGGSLGAILSIFLASFTASLQQAVVESSSKIPTIEMIGTSAGHALENLKLDTSARVGDRTVMDALIPFCEMLVKAENLGVAVQACKDGAESTRGMKARFGRATYVSGGETCKDTPPDPGAWAIYELFLGLQEGWN
ncbi:MAG: hypothetical protein M1834_000302 [Cirrosporium novae-zelandiae]|nr:MAG: hypothetical protein M1834_000302 [Cirrosporium novae-zelandiae]